MTHTTTASFPKKYIEIVPDDIEINNPSIPPYTVYKNTSNLPIFNKRAL